MAETYEIRSIFESSYIVAEFKQKWPYHKNAYPYTSLIENYGIGGTTVLAVVQLILSQLLGLIFLDYLNKINISCTISF